MKQSPILFSLFGSNYLANAIHQALGYDIGEITLHQFPDEETVIKIDSLVQNRDVVFITHLEHPNSKLLPLLFAAETARGLGCKKIGLIAPYLPYMRQDKQFHSGEGITSKYFATLISNYFDGLLTIDPHLHRWHSLSDLYSIPAKALHATKSISNWIKINVPNPLLIGPDAESSQWVSESARNINAPFLILEKIRKGDNIVEASMPNVELYQQNTPILIDDIISTAATMIETVTHLKSLKMKAPVCIGVHALFSGTAYDDLLKSGAKQIVTCNTIVHASNGIDMKDNLIKSIDTIFNV
ncbi:MULTISPECIES: ribose-phosphate pyrophosphokinase [Legionella]|jgi:ribose-phosphate pyrophosphokinase|uniref:ribose-phosphate pyrophosphokinase n=1 Tax=Legionella TaxID=445 RepID=UPI000E02CF0E|nr:MULTISPECIES: ribose-phosphate pyrophosphokinase [Legionella]MDX1838192.1 ribose-phosphate pyrophosphokinase [Legionella taurinensis]STY50050.1 ribose-phosphate pyrophosphokinase [Legionella worsleiensis]HAU1025116.1 ribose-phosphate pyrophosphokinase [Legionella pneumophila]